MVIMVFITPIITEETICMAITHAIHVINSTAICWAVTYLAMSIDENNIRAVW
jgi:alkylhydroperoxidase/carboxymuconolactone decarboxylase family protein YurZ